MSDHRMQQALVSIIIPTYNVEQFIRETIDSVLAQTYSHIEVIVTDDGSTDQTVPIAQEYAATWPNKLKVVTSPRNTGISSNFNRGLAVRTGEFIAWLGGDDIMFPEKIEKQVAMLRRRPDVIGCCHDAIVFQSEDRKDLGLFSELYSGRRGLVEGGIELFFNPGYKMLPSTMMIRSAYCPPHGFDDRLKYVNDILFDIEVYRQGRCAVLQEALGKYRRHGRNWTDSPGIKTAAYEENLLLLGIVQARYPELTGLAKKRRLTLTMTEAVRAYSQQDMARYGNLIKALWYEKARLRALATWLFAILFASSLTDMAHRPTHAMPHRFVKIVNAIRRRIS